jgi:pimeloyl-ACP methyl ester carboxylesterase
VTAVTSDTFETPTGVRLEYDLTTSGADALIIVSHGVFAHRGLHELETLTAALAERFDVLRFDCRGHGGSSGRFSFGQNEWRDLAALTERSRAGYRAVGGIGFSFGGFHTCLAAARARCFDAAMLVSTPKDFGIADHLPSGRGLAASIPRMRARRRRRARLGSPFGRRLMPIQCIGEIAVPLHIVHGDSDWLIHHRHAIALQRAAPARTPLTILEGGLHAEYLIDQMPRRFLPLVADWFAMALRSP